MLSAIFGCNGGEPLVETQRKGRSRPALPEPTLGSSSTAWSNSSEYRDSNGLGLIRAAEGYAARTTGKAGGSGRTVAVIDSAVDLRQNGHDDLDGRAYTFLHDKPNFSDPEQAHGSHVAGTVAARRDGHGVHGVAYNADLVGIAVFRSVPRFAFPAIDFPADVAAAIASAAGLNRRYFVYDIYGNPVWETDPLTGLPRTDFFGRFIQESRPSNPSARANIMNMSFGGSDPLGDVLGAMRDAAGAGTIMVAALGNASRIGPSSAPAAYMNQSGIAGLGIAVGALDASGRGRASFSNTCGQTARYCLFAPGTDILSTVPGNRYERESGTSMASPHVAGAAAVVWAAFPNKSARDIVSRLLETARPIDGREISPVYGHGKLDLEAAMRPYGTTRLSVPGVGLVPLTESFVSLPAGFGAPSSSSLADTIVYDEQAFPFLHDLNSAFRTGGKGSSDNYSQWFLASMGRRSAILPAGPKAWLHVVPHSMTAGNDDTIDGYYMNFQPAQNLTVTVGDMSNPAGSPNGFATQQPLGAAENDDLRDDLSASPFAALAGGGIGVKFDWRWSKDTAVDVLGIDGSGYFGSTSAQLTAVGLKRRVGDGLVLGTRYGVLRERDARIGIVGKGAFQGIPNTTTYFTDLSVENRISDGVSLFGTWSYGSADGASPKRRSLVSKWSRVRANAFTVGSEIRWSASDRLFLTASSPFRVRNAWVTIHVPGEEIADGVVRHTPRVVSLTPRGHERRFQLIYETAFGADITSTVGAYARIEPNHDPSAKPEFGGAVKMHVSF